MNSEVEGEPLKFVLIDRTPGSDIKYVVQATSEEVKETWIKEIRSILDMQGDFLRGQSVCVLGLLLFFKCNCVVVF